MSLALKDYFKNTNVADVPIKHQQNAQELFKVVESLFLNSGLELIISSGYRSKQRQLDLYRAKGYKDSEIPMLSGHLNGTAIDLVDANGLLDKFCSENQDALRSLGLWQEHPNSTGGWCHIDMLQRPERYRPSCTARQFYP